ncbi:hypothetical protein QN362_07995 [Actimicrobium sp. CCC2.4]|uniref:hypothetical protein n=1 Tax=Actimicrobium sp. CCC2.4 TaxID=3048606 RepID=UPI002AC9B08B|nr:hypothetical protein [Actimicrobium sp. CCC2.4]MEB0135271.1 hypothetical protein [Actimicrobium sp. CCC2.4]WPX31063.1 hypothetical protein RHM62_12455 [Actimicrobium sp. CCC2.4]
MENLIHSFSRLVISHPLSGTDSLNSDMSESRSDSLPSSSSNTAAEAEQNAAICSAPSQLPAALRSNPSVRERIANLLVSQADQQPLPMLENLSRGNRQLAARAAVLASQASTNLFLEHKLPPEFRNPAQENQHLLKTGLALVVRESVMNAFSEPVFRIAMLPAKNPDASCIDPAAFAGYRTKAEVVVNELLSVLSDDQTNGAANNAVKVDLLNYQVWNDSTCTPNQSRNIPIDIDPGTSPRSHQTPEKIIELASLVETYIDLPYENFIKVIANHSPELATFFSFSEHALLIKDSLQEAPTSRYPYITDEAPLAGHIAQSGDDFVPTFLEGVKRDFYSTEEDTQAWKIQVDGKWQIADTKREVVNHVFMQALEHLQAKQVADPAMPIYPLVCYELLADAIDIPVPDYLKNHEQELLVAVTKNQINKENRQQEISQLQKKRKIDLQEIELAQQKTFTEHNVSNISQLLMCVRGFSNRLPASSVEMSVPLFGQSNQPDAINELRHRLMQTHCLQDISARAHHGSHDNACWLRASWLSVFACAAPEFLEARLRSISDPDNTLIPIKANLLKHLAQLYQQDVRAFMQGLPPGDTALSTAAARLGPAGKIENLLPAGDYGIFSGRSIESFLRQLQLHLAAPFRGTDRAFMSEIEGLTMPGSPASSNLPVTLHRALGLPVLVIETGSSVSYGEAGRQLNVSGELRIAAPSGSALAQEIEHALQQDAACALHPVHIIDRFSHWPILWLSQNHYDLHLPKSGRDESPICDHHLN